MPKKKTATKPIKKVVKKAVAKKAVVKKAAKSVKSAGKTVKKVVRSVKITKPERQPAVKKPSIISATKPVETVRAEPSLGRPLVTQEEKLYMLFHDDYLCRQVFEFLRVETIKELEQFSPQQIVHLMSRPIRMTVDRIRQRLAEFKRSLKDDEQFAADFGQAKK